MTRRGWAETTRRLHLSTMRRALRSVPRVRVRRGCWWGGQRRYDSGGPGRARALGSGPELGDFLRDAAAPTDGLEHAGGGQMSVPTELPRAQGSFFVETYGCQMNVSDTEIVTSILLGAGYEAASSANEADVVFLNTCAIRDNAEAKVWNRLAELRAMRRKQRHAGVPAAKAVGVLGCMAERLKERLLEEAQLVDLVAGPDAYRDLPALLHAVSGGDKAVNVQLSAEETYADVAPVRRDSATASAFVSIMRGCNNMCSFCIVPFTRGRERSRPVPSIVDEVRRLVDEGYREVVLLGQNVNSYHDSSAAAAAADSEGGARPAKRFGRAPRTAQGEAGAMEGYDATPGFRNMYQLRGGSGPRFADLLDEVSRVSPELRVRFTSPHPKDFPAPLLDLIAERPNVCSNLHMPAQSGSTSCLARMRRGYTREAYLELVERARATVPDVAVSTDMIAGFCGETEEEHRDSLSLMRRVRYETGFLFAYSMRERTHAHRRLQDDVPEAVKQRRLREIIDVFRAGALEANCEQVGRRHLVLVEGHSRRSSPEAPQWQGRTDSNLRVVFDDAPVAAGGVPDFIRPWDAGVPAGRRQPAPEGTLVPPHASLGCSGGVAAATAVPLLHVQPGDYVLVEVLSASPSTLYGAPLARTTLSEHAAALSQV